MPLVKIFDGAPSVESAVVKRTQITQVDMLSAVARPMTMRLLALSGLVILLTACGRDPSEAELLKAARGHLASRDVPAAIIDLKNALQASPQSAEARLLLGKVLLLGGDAAAAEVELEKATAAGASQDQVVPELARVALASGEAAKVIGQYAQTRLGDSSAQADLLTSVAAAHLVLGQLDQGRSAVEGAVASLPTHAPALVLLARLHLGRGDVDKALALLGEVLRREPGHEVAGLLKAEVLVRSRQDRDGALVAVTAVTKAHPNSLNARVALINALARAGRADEARTAFEGLKKQSPQHPETVYLEAQFAFASGQDKAAAELLQALLAKLPTNPRALMLAGASEYRQHRYVQAAGLWTRALQAAPKAAQVRRLLAQAYLSAGDPAKSVEVLLPIVQGPQADATSLAMAAEALLQQGQAKQAQVMMQRALRVGPDDPRIRTSAAVAQLAAGDAWSAISDLESLARDPRQTRARLALISAHMSQGDTQGALRAIEQLQPRTADDPAPQLLRGRVQLAAGDLVSAARSFEAAQAKDPKSLAAATGLADVDLRWGQTDRARGRFRQLMVADPDDYRARLALAGLETRLGAPDAAVIELLQEAAKISQVDATAHVMLVDRQLAAGDVNGALASAQAAKSFLPDELPVLDALGRAQLASGDRQSATSTFARVLTQRPGHVPTLVHLAEARLAAQDAAGADRALQQARASQPDNLAVIRAQALLALASKRPSDGTALARQLQAQRPKDPAGFALEGELAGRQADWISAARAYRAAFERSKTTVLAVELHRSLLAGGKATDADRLAASWRQQHPRDSVFLTHLGDAASSTRQWAKAESLYREVVSIQPSNALMLNNIAWLMVQQGKAGAVDVAKQANQLLPERAPLLDTLALALEADKQWRQALPVRERAVAASPKEPTLRLRLAQLLLNTGDKSKAKEHLEMLARLGPDFAGQDVVATLLKQL